MRTLFFLAALLLAPAAHAQTLEDLSWLRGCWRTTGDGPVITEVWSAPPMPAMIGYSYTARGGETLGWEAMRIEMIDGAPVFVAMPSGGNAVRFRYADGVVLVREGPDGDGAIFENADHDYPQRIEYLRVENRLTATISRIDRTDPMTFEYRRISCAADLRP